MAGKDLGDWPERRALCPCFQRGVASWLYPVEGYCCARGSRRLMIPPAFWYIALCTTEHFTACEVYREHRRRSEAGNRAETQQAG